MSKWVLDTQSDTVIQADYCVIFDDGGIDFETEEDFIEYGSSVGADVLDYCNDQRVTTSWSAEDVQTLVADLTDKQALEALQKVSKVLHEQSVIHGWEILEVALTDHGYKITKDGKSK